MPDTNPMPYEKACDREVEVGIDLRSTGVTSHVMHHAYA